MSQKSHKRALISYWIYVSYYIREHVYYVFCVRGAGLQIVITIFILIKNIGPFINHCIAISI